MRKPRKSRAVVALEKDVAAKRTLLSQVELATATAIGDLRQAQALLFVLLEALHDRADKIDASTMRLALFAQADSIKATMASLVPLRERAREHCAA